MNRQGETGLARHFEDFLRRHGAGDMVAAAAAAVLRAMDDGHVCLPLDHEAALRLYWGKEALPAGDWRRRLAASPWVSGPGDAPAPLVLDRDRLYLYRYWEYEQVLAARLLRAGSEAIIDEEEARAAVEAVFGPPPESDDGGQRRAVEGAARFRLSVITGGPGTGKTYTVARILAVLTRLYGPELRVALAAPTGKAAARLQSSLEGAAATLPPGSLGGDIPRAATIHRLLGWRPPAGGFRHGPDHPLALDVLVVDEASMIDLPLMAALVGAMPEDGRLILLGDPNQLAAVESGRVLADISAAAGAVPVTALTRSYRFGDDSAIGTLARAVLAGEAAASSAVLRGGGDVQWLEGPLTDRQNKELIYFLVNKHFATLAMAKKPKEALAALGSFQILAPHREGAAGVRALNLFVEAVLREQGYLEGNSEWYPGRPVMVTGNHYHLGLFNGDVGVCLPWRGDLQVFFPDPEGGTRAVAPARMPPHETSYAITVHKSQGSEYDEVLLVLPDEPTPLIGRELLYTAVTRSRRRFYLRGRAGVWEAGVAARNRRFTGLAERLRGASGVTVTDHGIDNQA